MCPFFHIKHVLFNKKRFFPAFLLIWLLVVGFYHYVKPLPDGVSLHGREWPVPAENVSFMYDLRRRQGYVLK